MAEVYTLMTRQIHSISVNATLQEAAKKMQELQVGSLLVVRMRRPMGIVTGTDITVKGVAAGMDPAVERVWLIMSTPLLSVDVHAPVEEAERLMDEKGTRHLAVRRKGRVVGMISARDLMRYFSEVASAVQGKAVSTDKREYVRLPLTAVVEYQDGQKREYKAVTYDISGGGLFIQTTSHFPIGSSLSIELTLPQGEKSIMSQGVVTWLRKENGNGIKAEGEVVYVRGKQRRVTYHPGMGIRFTDIAEEDRTAIMTLIAIIKDTISPPQSRRDSSKED